MNALSSPRASIGKHRALHSAAAGNAARKQSSGGQAEVIAAVLGRESNKPAAEVVVERILKAADPHVMSVPVYYDYKKDARVYKCFPSTRQVSTLFAMDGNTIAKDSPEALQQEEDRHRRIQEVEVAAAAETNPDLVEEGVSTRILKNQFNYSDRGSQTMNQPMKERTVMTDPPPSASFGGLATAWAIYDAYEGERIQAEKAAAAQRRAAQAARTSKDEENALTHAAAEASIRDGADVGPKGVVELLASPEFRSALQVMERMVNQNDCQDIIDDFKYWEDQSDLYKEDGTLLPLWRFFTEKTRKKAVTAIALNGRYSDLFAVGYGSYDFLKPCKGTVHCFTLKNAVPTGSGAPVPAHPEFSFHLDCGVLCLAFHPREHSLLACGLYDGSVCVFDMRVSSHDTGSANHGRPLYRANVRTGKHMDPVWQIMWMESTPELSFYSISTDGRVANWMLSKRELTSRDVLKLNTGVCTVDPEQMLLNELGGMSFDYSPAHDKMVVGTQEGNLLLCTVSHNGQCVERYEGHSMAVYTTRWSPFHPDIFLTCSADWTVKLWTKGSPSPLVVFDLGDAVGDVAWAPYSSTVFAAVTAGGKVCVFDVAQNKTEPLCAQTVVKNAKLTHIVFSEADPILFVGDTRGTVLTLKLSPNLRKVSKPGKGEPTDAAHIKTLEVEKLNHLVEVTMKDRALLGV
ncbi:dynein intermediate-chain-like protein [Leishmania infantum JPCM5]|uniref:Dynein_intermediate_chain_1_-_axonemal n=2 Tax=Leishmania infantum TaxID=5671 RepID=A0A6L0XEK2_LEIIN|nr:dynein intermediate-chain-like protein [Leishmania infantum JPCM5]CAC9490923.1 Dynein_intermediate_chain_1_-_axonemal [Leishmania infantum]CBZ08708.1 dynein intermediate-chain-like protein [Leishmania infantum JPCM5]SUZ42106.1 Dynein_intermediate_chain_1_-_axonemal [Leishmania infantum]|eukprot:XP_003392540.1 dynein intermediate-chain-like protein [Leishmania infantum JPCM5]